MIVELTDYQKTVLKDFIDVQLSMLEEVSEDSEFDLALIAVLLKLSKELE